MEDILIRRRPASKSRLDFRLVEASLIELASREPDGQIQPPAAAQNIIGDAIADTIIQPNVRAELTFAHLQRFTIDAEDDIVLPDAGLPRRLGHERTLSKRQSLRTQAESFLFVGGQVIAVDPRRRIDAAQRPTPRNVRFSPSFD